MDQPLPFYDQIRDEDADDQIALADRGMDFALIASRFNESIVNRLIEGAAGTLVARGADVERLELIRVPGALELPSAAALCIDSGQFDAIITLGCVIRGETSHFDYVAGECARGIVHLASRETIPIMFGVLTTDDRAQAEARAQLAARWEPETEFPPGLSNKGAEAAAAALEMIEIVNQWSEEEDDEDDED